MNWRALKSFYRAGRLPNIDPYTMEELPGTERGPISAAWFALRVMMAER